MGDSERFTLAAKLFRTTLTLVSALMVSAMGMAGQAPASVKEFGAVGDGVADDTAAVQKAMDSGRQILFPQGTYLITAQLNVPSKANLLLTPKTTIRFQCQAPLKSVFLINNAKSIKIDGDGGKLIGDLRQKQFGAHTGISILGDSSDINIDRLTFQDFPDDTGMGGKSGDGIYIGGPLKEGPVPGHIAISRCNFTNNRRNQITIAAGANIQIDHCHMTGSALDGVDLEPSADTDTEENIKVLDNVITGSRCGVSAVKASKHVLMEGNQITIASDEETKSSDLGAFEGLHVDCTGPDVVVKGNEIHGGYVGISATRGSATVEGNEVESARCGVWIHSSGVTVNLNKIVDAWEAGVKVEGNDAKITNNTIQDVGDQTKLFNHKVSTPAAVIQVTDGFINGTIAGNTIKDTRPHGENRVVVRLPAADKGGPTWKSDIKP